MGEIATDGERMAARLRFLAEASQEFSEATDDYDRLLAAIARRLGEVIGDLCSIRAVNEDGTTLEPGVAYHRDPEVLVAAESLLATYTQQVGEGAMGRVAASGQPLFIPKISPSAFASSSSPQYANILERLRVGSVIVAPMMCRGKVVGVASLLRSGADNPYTQDDLLLVRSLAGHAALAIDNARSYAAARAARAAAVDANKALHDSEIAHRLLFEASPMAVLVFDLETLNFLAVNDAAVRLYGYTHDQFLGMKLKDLRFEGERVSTKSKVDRLSEGETTGTARHQRKDGSQFFAEYTSRALTFSGRVARITVVADVTARQDAEETRVLLAAIVRSSNDAIVSKRLDGTMTSWNDAAERLYGYAEAEAIGQPIFLLVPSDRHDEERNLLERVAAGERIEHFETIRRRKDGSDVAVSLSVAPILDAAGKVVGASKTARDLTLQRKAEAALKHTEEQLRQAQKMEAVGRLAGGIAHDFNNILSVILSCSEFILDDQDPTDETRGDIGEIRKAALRAADLTKQLLLFSRQQVVAPTVLDMNEVLTGVDKMLRRILGEDIDLVFAPGPRLGRVLADPSHIEQIIMNLVVNARDAMPTGGKLTIETGNVELDENYTSGHLGARPGPHVMLAVSDTGIGMDSATIAHIFEPFFTTKEMGKGTGLGLSTVFGIAQRSGGSVWVYSEPGKGATFKVYFPLVEGDVEVARHSVEPVTLQGTETVLLVEDQDQVRAVAYGILKRYGYQVVVAQDAGEAVTLSDSHPGTIHALLTDVVMPLMSGAELARRIALKRPGTKVLFMSGYTDDSIVRHGVLERSASFLQKPFTPESLARKLREVLDATATVQP